jgi:glycosyltransferase involved in cell wall biosynthesis
MSCPAISIVVPVYNRADLLNRALNSALVQTYQNFEVLVVDDGSNDNPEIVVEEIDDPRLRCLRHPDNLGGAAARNTGIASARGEYIAFLDSDDEWLPHKLESQMRVFRDADTRLGVVYTRAWIDDGQTRHLGRKPTKRGDIYEYEIRGDYVTQTSTWLVRSECFEKVGNFDIDLPSRQDYDMSLRISRLFHYDFLVDPLVILYIASANRITSDVGKRIQGSLKVLAKIKGDINHLSKHAQKKILSYHMYAIGRFCIKSGELDLARCFIRDAINIYPFSVKYWLVYLSSCGGMNVHKKIAGLVSRFKSYLDMEIQP